MHKHPHEQFSYALKGKMNYPLAEHINRNHEFGVSSVFHTYDNAVAARPTPYEFYLYFDI